LLQAQDQLLKREHRENRKTAILRFPAAPPIAARAVPGFPCRRRPSYNAVLAQARPTMTSRSPPRFAPPSKLFDGAAKRAGRITLLVLAWLLAVPLALARAPLLEGLGGHTHPISAQAPLVQRYFDQGLLLYWGFDYAEAKRSFGEAARLDGRCAMCEWGIALALGPNINHDMSSAGEAEARRHAARALALSDYATPRERAYIDALALRYGVTAPPPAAPAPAGKVTLPPPEMCGAARPKSADRATMDRRYADAMGAVARRFPDDLDAAVLWAEALMVLSPWDYWTPQGEPRADTPAILAALEGVLREAPEHPGANHFYIHALEASPYPQRALPAAGRLGALVPVAGHLVHMPAHIYMRVGRYHDASLANERAIAADHWYAEQLREQGYSALGHVAHHDHFLWASASMEGRGAAAIAAADRLAAVAAAPDQPFGSAGSNEYYRALPLFARVRFERWSEILAASEPPGVSAYPAGVWHFARGVALARTGNPADAEAERAALGRAAADPELGALHLKGIDSLADLLAVAVAVLDGEIALAAGRNDAAVSALRAAVALEDRLDDKEPPPWAAPPRLRLGDALLAAGEPRAAEQVFRDDLARHPENGWALRGLAESLEREGRAAEARAARERLRAAWRYAESPFATAQQ
jgi:tetratricopeptide (TPR) repeat protein